MFSAELILVTIALRGTECFFNSEILATVNLKFVFKCSNLPVLKS